MKYDEKTGFEIEEYKGYVIGVKENGLGNGKYYCFVVSKGTYTKATSYRFYSGAIIKNTYSFKTIEDVNKYIETKKNHIDEKEKNKKKRITAEHTWKVDDIGVYSWGYDQTNIDYYQVTRTTKSSIWVRPIGYASMEGNGCFDQYNVTPAKDHFIGSEIMKRVVFSEYNGKINEYVNMPCGLLSHWGGKPNLKTCYA